MSYRDLIAQERAEYIGRKVLYKGQPYTIVDVDYNGGLLIDKKAEHTDTTAVYRFDKDLILDYTSPKGGNTMPVSEKKKASNAKWDAANTRQYKLKLNLRTDADILAKLDATDNVQGYIKQLIREDMKRESD